MTDTSLPVPDVGDRYAHRAATDRIVIVNAVDTEEGVTRVFFEWRDGQPGVCRGHLRLETFHRAYEPATVANDTREPIALRWGLDDVLHGDDDTVTVMLSGPNGEPYWLELELERAAALRAALAPSQAPAVEADARDRADRLAQFFAGVNQARCEKGAHA